jgi:hypothetical protein
MYFKKRNKKKSCLFIYIVQDTAMEKAVHDRAMQKKGPLTWLFVLKYGGHASPPSFT